MRRQHPYPKMEIPISMPAYRQLLDASGRTGYEKEDWEIAAEAIEEWMRRHHPDAIPMPAAAGYQWKSQFLPNGTLLRTVFGGTNYHCLVEGDRILYNGQAVSPSGFVNAVGGIRRNAWRSIWILFPESKDWKLANSLRSPVRPRRARKPEKVVQQGPVDMPPADSEPVTPQPAASQLPAQSNCRAQSTAAAPAAHHANLDHVPINSAGVERRKHQQANGITLSPHARCARAIDADATIGAMLRQELLPLLYRMCALDGEPN